MTVDVKVFDDLDAVMRDAGGALDRAGQASLYDRMDWLRLTHRHFPTLRAMIVRARAGEHRGWLFLARKKRRAAAFGSWYTLEFGPIFTRGCDRDVKLSLLSGIAARLRGKIASLALQPLKEDAAALLAAGFNTAGWRARRSETSANWIALTEGLRPDIYFAARPSRLRSTLKRKAQQHPIDVRIADRFDPADWADYETVFERSWKPNEGSMPFLRDLAQGEGAAGTLRLGLGYRDARPVAAQLWLVENDVATIHKLAHDSSEDACSPGTQLTAAMFAHVLDRDRPRMIDFGSGDDPYKSDWMDEQRPLFTLDLADPRTLAGFAGTLRWKAAALVRDRATD